MSFIIQGIDLPKEKDVVIKIKPNGKVLKQLAFETVFVETEAEAIQIPNDHGRLIDGDKLIERLKSDNPQTSKNKWMSIVTECAPTILEAENK